MRKGYSALYPPRPSYEPYYATGDFNGDGVEDVAVVAVPVDKAPTILIVVLFGKTAHGQQSPVEVPRKEEKGIVGIGLFAEKPSAKSKRRRWTLDIGAFESEAEEIHIFGVHDKRS